MQASAHPVVIASHLQAGTRLTTWGRRPCSAVGESGGPCAGHMTIQMTVPQDVLQVVEGMRCRRKTPAAAGSKSTRGLVSLGFNGKTRQRSLPEVAAN